MLAAQGPRTVAWFAFPVKKFIYTYFREFFLDFPWLILYTITDALIVISFGWCSSCQCRSQMWTWQWRTLTWLSSMTPSLSTVPLLGLHSDSSGSIGRLFWNPATWSKSTTTMRTTAFSPSNKWLDLIWGHSSVIFPMTLATTKAGPSTSTSAVSTGWQSILYGWYKHNWEICIVTVYTLKTSFFYGFKT